MTISFILFLFSIVIIASFLMYKVDCNNWNNGKCHYCGNNLKYKSLYKNFIRTYKCPKCGKEIIITWNVDKDKYRNLEDYEK